METLIDILVAMEEDFALLPNYYVQISWSLTNCFIVCPMFKVYKSIKKKTLTNYEIKTKVNIINVF